MVRIRSRLSLMLAIRKMSFKQLAKLSGVRPSTVSDYAYDMLDRINLRHFEKFCEILECKLEDLLEVEYTENHKDD